MAPRETENNAYAKFGVTNKEHFKMVMVFFWSGYPQSPLTLKTHK